MGNQDCPPPNVERLEPRLTLSTPRPARVPAKFTIPHAGHTEVVPPPIVAQASPPIKARSLDGDPPSDGLSLPDRTEWRLPAHGGFALPSSDGESGHGGGSLHAETTAQPGQIAFAADHDPAHFALVPAYAVSAAPYPVATSSHDGPGMVMGSGASSRVVVGMPMDHRASPMPRMTPTRGGKPMIMHMSLEPAAIEAASQEGPPHGHDLDPGLDPELSPESEPEISPSLALPEMPMADLDPGGEADPVANSAAPAQASTGAAKPDAEHAGPRLAALSGVATLFHRNLVAGRVERDEPAAPGEPLRGLAMRVRSLLTGLRLGWRRTLKSAGR